MFYLPHFCDTWSIDYENTFRCIAEDLIKDDDSALVLVMTWCRQAPSHYMIQCWPRSAMPYGFTRSQCVKNIITVWHPTFTSLTGTQLSNKLQECELTLLENLDVILEVHFSNSLYKIAAWPLTVKVLSGECHKASLRRTQHWLRQQAITCANLNQDLCQLVAPLSHKGLNYTLLMY